MLLYLVKVNLLTFTEDETMSNFYEDRCGRVAFERVLEVNEEMSFLDKSGHILSCGGVYVARDASLLPSENRYEFLNLPAYHKPVLTLKNNEVQIPNELAAPVRGEELLDSMEEQGLKKMMREHMN